MAWLSFELTSNSMQNQRLQETHLRRMLAQHKYSAAAAFLDTSLHLAGA